MNDLRDGFDAYTGETCPHCGEPAILGLFEVWGHEFMLDVCCEGAHEDALELLRAGGPEARALLRDLGVEDVTGYELRRCADCEDVGQLLLDFSLEVREISFAEARDFVGRHHAHNRPPRGWRFGAGIWNGADLIGVVMVGRPVARMIDGRSVVEVNRLCVRRDLPAGLRWNACSQLYGWAAREAGRRGFLRIITYTLESEPATTLKAVGWTAAARTRGGSWNRPSRARGEVAPLERKIRWERELRRAA